LNKTQQARKKAFAEALTLRHLEVLLRVHDYNDAIDQIDSLIERLESKADLIKEAVTEYNEAVGAAQDFITEIRDSAQEYFDSKSDDWKEGAKGEGRAGPAFSDWLDTLDSLPDLEELDEDVADPDLPDTLGDTYRIDQDLGDESNAAVIAEIPDGPSK